MAIDTANVVSGDAGYDLRGAAPLTQTQSGRLRVEASGSDGSAPNATKRLASSAATTNPTVVKAGAGSVWRITGFNANAAARYLKVYDKATAPTVGTDVPIWTEYLPAQAKFFLDLNGLKLATGIGFALTTGGADNDNSAVTSGDILALNISYS